MNGHYLDSMYHAGMEHLNPEKNCVTTDPNKAVNLAEVKKEVEEMVNILVQPIKIVGKHLLNHQFVYPLTFGTLGALKLLDIINKKTAISGAALLIGIFAGSDVIDSIKAKKEQQRKEDSDVIHFTGYFK